MAIIKPDRATYEHLSFSVIYHACSYSFLLSSVCVYMLVCMHAHMWGGLMCVFRWPGGWAQEYFSTALHLSLWVRASQLIPEHVNIPSWASLFAPDSVASVSAVLKLQAGHHTYLAYTQVLDIWTLLSCWCGKCLFSWAICPAPSLHAHFPFL